MKKMTVITTLALLATVLLGGNALATASGFEGPAETAATGGFQGPTINAMTVKEVKKLRDDTPVVLVGKIERSLGAEKYLFTDATGSITVEIDNEDWFGITVTPEDTVVIYGEVDKGFRKLEIDVDRIALK